MFILPAERVLEIAKRDEEVRGGPLVKTLYFSGKAGEFKEYLKRMKKAFPNDVILYNLDKPMSNS